MRLSKSNSRRRCGQASRRSCRRTHEDVSLPRHGSQACPTVRRRNDFICERARGGGMSYYNRPPKDKCTAFLLLLFGGVFGLHRCYLDDIVCGIAFFLTGGWCLCGICCDCCYLSALVSAANMKYAAIPSHTTVQVIMHDPHYAPPHPPVYPDAAAHYTQVPVQQTPYYAPRPGAQLPYYAPPEVSLAVAPQPSAPVAQDSITGGKKLTD